ncbi:MAG: hypothetical protein HY282_00360 [Nitrospirae bacterium]|nr:hypothetical protein [Candidatus Manganitrophaceae bacterium]
MEIKKVNPELAFAGHPIDEELITLRERGYRMLIDTTMPEEFREPERRKAERAGLRYAELPVDAKAWSKENFLQLEEILFPQEARPALICSPQGRRSGVLALVWDAIQNAYTVEKMEERARQFDLNLPEIAKEYIQKNSPAYSPEPKLRVPEGLPFPFDDETLPGGFHRP